MSYRYGTSCVDCTESRVEALKQMIAEALPVSYATMRRHCPTLVQWSFRQGYERDPRKGLTLKNDQIVSYHKSTFEGRPCYYVCWSAIEYVWVEVTP
jgi:hypothetical protein